MYKCLFVCLFVATLVLQNEAFLIKHKTHGSIKPQIVYGPPEPIKQVDKEPLLTKDDYLAILSALKEKIVENNPITYIKNKIVDKFHKYPTPEYQLHPEFGFAHYNKLNYVPLTPVFVEPLPVAPVKDEKKS